jgi:hypothetical protein
MKTPREAFSRILEILDRMEIPYLVGGSVASALHGISRPTMDTDMVVDLPVSKVDEFAELLAPDFYVDAQVIKDAFAVWRPFNVIHFDSTYKFDFFPLANDEYSRTEFGRRRFVETRSFGDEPLECAMATAEDTVLRKLLWYRAGGEASERQWNDIRGVLQVSRAVLDFDYLRRWADHIGVSDLLTRLLDSPTP